jgi:hypothetical protein
LNGILAADPDLKSIQDLYPSESFHLFFLFQNLIIDS